MNTDLSEGDYITHPQPTGWTATNFVNTGGDHRGCSGGWSAYSDVGHGRLMSEPLIGSGVATVHYGDCWGEGQAMLYKNGKKIDETRDKAGGNGTKKTFSFHFGNGDRIELKERSEETYNTVLWLGSITFNCPPDFCKGSTCGDDDVAVCCDERTASGLTGYWVTSSCLCLRESKETQTVHCLPLPSWS